MNQAGLYKSNNVNPSHVPMQVAVDSETGVMVHRISSVQTPTTKAMLRNTQVVMHDHYALAQDQQATNEVNQLNMRPNKQGKPHKKRSETKTGKTANLVTNQSADGGLKQLTT